MSGTARLRLTLMALLGLALALTLGMLWMQDTESMEQAASMAERFGHADRERLEALVAEQAQKVLRPQAVLADGRRGELISGVQAAADRDELRAWAAGGGAAVSALAAIAAPMQSAWREALLLDKAGKVLAQYPAGSPSEVGADRSSEPLFKELSQPGVSPGIPAHSFARPKAPPKGAKPAGKPSAQLLIACGIDNGSGGFGGLLLVRTDVYNALQGADLSAFTGLAKALPGTVTFLLRGNGDEVWHSMKEPFVENLGSISPAYKELLGAMVKAPEGRRAVTAYDGLNGVLAWQRVGSVPEGAAPESVLCFAAFVPESAFGTGGAAEVEAPLPFYAKPVTLGLLALILVLPLLLGAVLLPKALEPFKATAVQARKIDPLGPLPALVFGQEADEDAASINKALNALVKRLQQAEDRVKELDAAIKRNEDASRAAAMQAAADLSGVRMELSAMEAAKQAAESKFEAAQKARQDADSQMANLRSGLETATKNTELKSAENRNLSTQVQDLMRALEEQRKVAEKAQEHMSQRDGEAVRLAAVNTLGSELKATLAVIKNYISTMLGSQGTISDAQQEFLGVVINKSARLERLIGDLVELSEIGSALKPLRLETTAPSALVQEALVNTRPQAEHKKISLDLAEGGTLSSVHVDKEKMGAVLRALLGQAVKVTSRNEKIGLLLSERESTVELRVTDPGLSLPPDRAAKVFNQFHGVDSQAGPEFIGTGLRFPILKSIVEAHGGKIWIESQVGRGKTFVVSMPKAGAQKAPVAAPMPAPAPVAAPPPPAMLSGQAPPSLPGLAALAPPAPAAPAPKPLAGLPPLGPPPAVTTAPAEPVKKPAVPLNVHKPAPVDETLNAPWKRKGDEMEELLDIGAPSAGNADFDKVFGAATPPLPPPKPASVSTSDLDAIFGGPAAKPSPPPPADKPASGGLNSMDDLKNMLG